MWKYITSPTYRMFCDLMMSQEVVNRRLNEMKDAIALSNFPPSMRDPLIKYRAMYGVEFVDAAAALKAQFNITS